MYSKVSDIDDCGEDGMAEDQTKLVVNYVKLWDADELQLKHLAEHYQAVVGTLFSAEAG